MGRLRNCPFCGKEVKEKYPYDIHHNEGMGKWLFDHTCDLEHPTDGVIITIYGKTEQEVVDKWNGVWHGEQHPAN